MMLRVKLLALVFAMLILTHSERIRPSPITVGGTLVVMVPSNDGLVVAADSRTTVLGINCDKQFKILVPSHPDRTIATVTGLGTILAAPSQPVPLTQICEHVSHGKRLLDIEQIVLGYLQNLKEESIDKLDIDGLAETCLKAVRDVKIEAAQILQSYRGLEMFQSCAGGL